MIVLIFGNVHYEVWNFTIYVCTNVDWQIKLMILSLTFCVCVCYLGHGDNHVKFKGLVKQSGMNTLLLLIFSYLESCFSTMP